MAKLKSFRFMLQTVWRAYSTRHSLAGCPLEWLHIFTWKCKQVVFCGQQQGLKCAELNLSAYGTPGAPISFIYAESRDKIVSNRMKFESDGPTFIDKSHNMWSNNLNQVISIHVWSYLSSADRDGCKWFAVCGRVVGGLLFDQNIWLNDEWEWDSCRSIDRRICFRILGKFKVLPQHIDYRVVSIRHLCIRRLEKWWTQVAATASRCGCIDFDNAVCVWVRTLEATSARLWPNRSFLELETLLNMLSPHAARSHRRSQHNTTHKRFFLSSSLCPPLCISFRSIACTRARHRFPIAISPTISSFVRALRNHFGFGLLYGAVSERRSPPLHAHSLVKVATHAFVCAGVRVLHHGKY